MIEGVPSLRKRCCKCKQPKALCEFGKDKSREDGLNPTCKACKRFDPKHKARIEKLKSIVNDYKLKVGCSRCGFDKDAVALDFHHTDNSKDVNVSAMVSRHRSLERVFAEIAKCVVLCSNCHRIMHKRQRQ